MPLNITEARRLGVARWRRPIAALLACTLTACMAVDAPAVPSMMRDSAGVSIVANQEAAIAEGRSAVTATPDLQIGLIDGAPELIFTGMNRATRLANGHIAIANTQTREIRLFDAEGRFLRSMGGQGQGPGEFQSVDGLSQRTSDSLVVVDDRLARATVFTSSGDYVRTVTLSGPVGRPNLIGMLSDGSMVTQTLLPFPRGEEGKLFENRFELHHFAPNGTFLGSLGEFPSILWRLGASLASLEPIEDGGVTHVLVSGGRVIVSTERDSEVIVLDVLAGKEARFRWSDAVRSVTQSDRDAFRDWRLSSAATAEERVERLRQVDRRPWPETFRSAEDLKVDIAGNVWVRRFHERWLGLPYQEWLRFDSDGTWQETVALPADIEVLEITEEHVLARWRDELQVEYLRLYRLAGHK